MTGTASQVLSGEIAQGPKTYTLMDSTFNKEPKISVLSAGWASWIFSIIP